MGMTPLDIHNKEFGRAMRGYNPQEVDDFLNQVVREFEKLVKDNAALREQIETLNSKVEQYRNLEDTLHNTLVVAQATSDEVKESARREADNIVKEAQLKADEHVHQAQKRAERIIREYQGLRRQLDQFRAQFKGMLHSHLELLEEQRRDMDAVQPLPALSLDGDEDGEPAAEAAEAHRQAAAAQERPEANGSDESHGGADNAEQNQDAGPSEHHN